jgi:hypothetical protein
LLPLKSLRRLQVSNGGALSDESLKQLMALPNIVSIQYFGKGESTLTPEGIANLKPPSSLQQLRIGSHSGEIVEALKKWQETHPEVELSAYEKD